MIWIVFHSQTEAMRCRGLFTENHLDCRLTQPPRRGKCASCAWALEISPREIERARALCIQNGFSPCAYLDGNGVEL